MSTKQRKAGEPAGNDLGSQVDPFRHVGDEHWGKGGDYVIGADGRRVPSVPAPAVAPADQPQE